MYILLIFKVSELQYVLPKLSSLKFEQICKLECFHSCFFVEKGIFVAKYPCNISTTQVVICFVERRISTLKRRFLSSGYV